MPVAGLPLPAPVKDSSAMWKLASQPTPRRSGGGGCNDELGTTSARHVDKPDLVTPGPVERFDGLRRRLQGDFAPLLLEEAASFRRQMHVARMASADDEEVTALLEDELGLVFGNDVRCPVVLLR